MMDDMTQTAAATPEKIMSEVCTRLLGDDMMVGRPLSGDRVLQAGDRRLILGAPIGAAAGWFLWTDEAAESGAMPGQSWPEQVTGGAEDAAQAVEEWVRHNAPDAWCLPDSDLAADREEAEVRAAIADGSYWDALNAEPEGDQ